MSWKVFVCSNTAWYVWKFRLRLMESLRDSGYDVVAVAPHDEYVQKITAAGFRFIPVVIDRRGTNPVAEIFLIARYCRIIRAECPDIILSYTPKPNIYATLAARLYRVPVINNIAGLGFIFIQGGVKASIVRMLYKAALSFSHLVFFQNKDDMGEFVQGGLVATKKSALLPGSGVDTSVFKPRPKTIHHEGFIFLVIARMLYDKGVGEYVHAAQHLKGIFANARFLLLGPTDPGNPAGIDLQTLEQWNSEGVVKWMGSSDDVRDAIANCDCVVLPSYREGMPRTLLEAASMGKPVITTDEPGCREAVLDGATGYLCRSRDAGDLAAKMEKLLLMAPAERIAMGDAGRERMICEFDEQIVIDRYVGEIASVLSFK